jgi:hypothetical protein
MCKSCQEVWAGEKKPLYQEPLVIDDCFVVVLD